MPTFNKYIESIGEVKLCDFGDDSSHLLVMNLVEFINKYKCIAAVPHRISFYQIVLVTEGEGCFWVDSHKYCCGSRSMYAIAKGQIEVLEFSNNIKGYVLLFTEEFLNKYPGDLEWVNNLKLFDPLADSLLTNISIMEFIELMAFVKKIERELKTKNDFASNEILVNLLKTLILVSERISRASLNSGVKSIRDWEYVNEFKKNLEKEFEHARSVHYYADYLGITPKKLNQVTNNFWGKSAKRLIEERVLLEIQRLLIHTNKTIKEIGYNLGFNDPTNFNKYFKRYFGITPAEFRLSKQKSVI